MKLWWHESGQGWCAVNVLDSQERYYLAEVSPGYYQLLQTETGEPADEVRWESQHIYDLLMRRSTPVPKALYPAWTEGVRDRGL